MESPTLKPNWCINPCVVHIVSTTTLTHTHQLNKYSIRMSPTVQIPVTWSTKWKDSLVMEVVLAGDISDTSILVEVAPDMISVIDAEIIELYKTT